MKKRRDSLRKLVSALFLIITIGGFSAGEAVAQRMIIDFNDPAWLLAIPGDCPASIFSGAPLGRANHYKEKGMTFTDGVNPPDPELGGQRRGFCMLNYQDKNITYEFVKNELTAGGGGGGTSGGFVPVSPENENRITGPSRVHTVIQMTYTPDGVPIPFSLISLVVHQGKLNLGTKSAIGRICVYNNLTGGDEWGLTGDCATNLTRATLEAPIDGLFLVDRIVFEPASSRSGAAPSPLILMSETKSIEEGKATPVKLDNVLNAIHDALLFELLDLVEPVFATLDIKGARVKLRGPAQDQFRIRGTIDLGDQSDSVNIRTEPVMITFAGFREYIPAGLFRCNDRACDFDGTPGGITDMRIVIAKDKLRFLVTAEDIE